MRLRTLVTLWRVRASGLSTPVRCTNKKGVPLDCATHRGHHAPFADTVQDDTPVKGSASGTCAFCELSPCGNRGGLMREHSSPNADLNQLCFRTFPDTILRMIPRAYLARQASPVYSTMGGEAMPEMSPQRFTRLRRDRAHREARRDPYPAVSGLCVLATLRFTIRFQGFRRSNRSLQRRPGMNADFADGGVGPRNLRHRCNLRI